MKNNKGITLIALMLTVFLLILLGGVIAFQITDTYNNSKVVKFKSYMKMVQKNVDVILEEGIDYNTLGQALTSDQQVKLQEIISADANNLIDTTDVTSSKLRVFDTNAIYEVFDILNISDEIVVNFEIREVISLNGVEKDGITYYVERGL